MSRTADDLQQVFTARGLAAYWPALRPLLKPCIHLTYAPTADEHIRLGASKLGGRPDLPQHLHWPAFARTPLTFVAQLNLAELPNSEQRHLLPADGLLSFFFSAANDDYAASPHAVLLTPGGSLAGLERKGLPAAWSADERVYPAGSITALESRPSLPSGESEEVAALFLGPIPEQATPEQYARRGVYWRLAEPDDEPANQLFGYPAHSDGSLELICECIATGDRELRQLRTFTDEQRAALRRKWVLLLQVASNPDLEMYFGADLDYHYFWITQTDLARQDFSRTVAFSVH